MAIKHVYICAAWQTSKRCIISQVYVGYVIKVHFTPRFYESQHNFLNVVSKLLIIIIEIVIVFLLRFCIEILTEFEKMSLVIEGTNASPRINKRPMGHIAHLRNQVQINEYI